MTRRENIQREIDLLKELKRRGGEPAKNYKPYKPQLEFSASRSKGYSELCLMAGNQLGKTLHGAMEVYYHLSGLYPDWWEGIRFEKAPVIWIGGDTGETIRDTTQRLLLGRPGKLDEPDEYDGIVPLRLLKSKPKPAMGTPNLFDHFKVKHVSGGTAYCYLKAYAKGRKKWQGETVDLVWFDEEPPEDIYSEGLTRTNNGQCGQQAMLTFTPLQGMSNVVSTFILDPSPQQKIVKMTIDDVDHYTEEEKKKIVASYPEHEREARANGIPIMGSGRVFPVTESEIKEPHITKPPDWWTQIIGIDFGWDHPTAAALLWHDPENDVVHVRQTYRKSKVTPLLFAARIKSWGEHIPVSWPHDGLQHDKGSGEQLASQYKKAGLNMLEKRATFEDGTNGVEAGIMDMLTRMQTGGFKVDKSLHEFFEEFRLYHRKDGVIVKLRDDIMSAIRYGIMMLRFAVPIKNIAITTINRTRSSWR